jgi:hypothetical protein
MWSLVLTTRDTDTKRGTQSPPAGPSVVKLVYVRDALQYRARLTSVASEHTLFHFLTTWD